MKRLSLLLTVLLAVGCAAKSPKAGDVVDCPKCEGCGKLKAVKCKTCDGKGTVTQYDIDYESQQPYTARCPDCRGGGVVMVPAKGKP